MAERQQDEVEKLIAEKLSDAGIKFVTQQAIAGLAPDFIVHAPDGRQFIVEAKNWDFPGLKAEASRQAQHYQDAAKADGAFIVIPSLKRGSPEKGVVTVDGLVPALKAEFENSKTRTHPSEATKVSRIVFAAMPFAPQYEDVFFIAMRQAAEQVRAVCERVDRREFQGSVVDEIQRLIRQSVLD
jgi:hypothetical protein